VNPVATKKPKWSDDDAVLAWVSAELEAQDLEAERQHAMLCADCDTPGPPVGEVLKRVHDEAIRDAERENNFELLESLARGSPLSEWFRLLGVDPMPVGSKAMNFLVDRATGKIRGRRGKPGPSTQERWRDPVRDAVCDMVRIQAFLHAHYPREKGLRERAMKIAAQRGGVRVSTLRNRLK
jgi:hypothetical protein